MHAREAANPPGEVPESSIDRRVPGHGHDALSTLLAWLQWLFLFRIVFAFRVFLPRREEVVGHIS